MIIKGIVSAIYPETNTVAVILPEYDNAVTQPLRLYGEASVYTLNINDFVAVLCFNDDFNDGIVIGSGANISINVKEITAEVDDNTGMPYVNTHISGDADGLSINFAFKNLKGKEGKKGDSGATYTPTISEEGILSWTNDKELENPEPVPVRGRDGATFIPHIDENGILSWTNDEGLTNPEPVDLTDPRVTNLLAALLENPDYVPTAEVVDGRLGYDGTRYELIGDAIRAVGIDLLTFQDRLKDYVDKQAVDGLLYEDNKLYLTAGGEIVSDPIEIIGGSGGGGGGTTSVVKLINEGESVYNVTTGADVFLKFNFTSTDDGVSTGNGTAKIIVNGATKATLSVNQGSNTINVKDYLSDGENTVKVTCTDVYGAYKTLTYAVNIIVLSISSTFDDTQIYSGDITFRFTPVGLMAKNIYFEVDGTIVDTWENVEVSGKQSTKVFEAMPHGSHKLVVYMASALGDVPITSNRLVYDIMCVEDGKTAVIIASPFEGGEYTEGDLIEIPFSVYDPNSLTAAVTITFKNESGETKTTNLTVDRTRQKFSTRDYSAGNIKITIASGSVKKEFSITVAGLNIDVEAETENLELYLTSSGRSNSEDNPAVWQYGEFSTTFTDLNWVDTGWVADEKGDTTLRLAGDAKAVIGFTPFSQDARVTGKTIELEYAVRDVNNRDAVVISCMSGGTGFQATADRAFISSEQSKITCYYRDEERIRVAFVIEPRTDYRLLSIYLNGILSGAIQYPDNDNFQQAAPVEITLGSELCSLDFYAIRSYSAALTADQIRDNYISDMLDIDKKIELYNENDIYDGYGRLTFDDLVKKIPTMVITGKLPTAKGDKQNVNLSYTDPFNPELNFEDTAEIDVQGTSSQWYVRKNWKIETSEMHQHAPNQLPAQVFCMKADYAESTGTHNTGNANYAHTLYNSKTPPQVVDPLVRTTIYGFPSVIFHKADESSEPEFIGKYNFNYDKGAENVFGFSASYPQAECWEFCNNTSDACLFKGEVPASFKDDFEARYPDGYKDISAFKVMHDWVLSTRQDAATGTALTPAYTDVDGITHTADTAAYRLAKFKTEFRDHFNKDFCLVYYVYTLTMLMVDQRAKNMFLTTWDGVHWEPWLYDNDTCLGINNEGALVFDYYHEDIDELDGANVYNGQDSTLWVNFREAFSEEIRDTYYNMRSSEKITFDKIYDSFITNQSDKWSISVYNEDSDYKYVSMLRSNNDASNLNQIRGSGKEHLGYFVENRLKYLDSKFNAPEYADNYVSLRIYTPSTYAGVTPNADITITPYSNMYAGVKYKANGTLQQLRAEKNTPVTFDAPDETFNDTETAIFGASEISSLGDLSPLYCGSVNVSKATKLTEIIAGSAAAGYSNTYLKELIVGTNRLLQKVDVRNCPALTAPLALSACPHIEEIYASGTSITGVELPASGYLKVMHLPATLTNLTIRNQKHITDFRIAGCAALKTLWIENSSIDEGAIVKAAPNLDYVRLLNVNWNLDGVEVLEVLSACKGLNESGLIIDNPIVTGTAHVPSISQSELKRYNEIMPDLEITYDEYIVQYEVIFKDWDGTVLDTQYITSGNSAVEPVAAGRINAPTRTATAQYTYTFTGWSGDYTNITGKRVVTAAYSYTVNVYRVRFYNGTTLLQSSEVEYGGTAIYMGSIPEYNGTETGDFLFDSWSESVINITGNVDAYATYKKCVVPSEVTAFADCDWAQIKAISSAGAVDSNGKWAINGTVWWSVGDEKTITMADGEEVVLQIWGFNHDVKTDGSGNKAPLTIGTKNLLLSDAINNWTSKTGQQSWKNGLVRSYLNDTVYLKLPEAIKTVICEVYKLSNEGELSNIIEVADKLFIPSAKEVYASYTYNDGETYPIFTNNTSRKKYKNGTAENWWTRSMSASIGTTSGNTSIRLITTSGSVGNYACYSNTKYDICFAFCI